MFRIPDYVAGTRPDGVSPQSAFTHRRAVTRLGVPSAVSTTPVRRQSTSAGETASATLPQRPPTAEERRLQAHMARRQAEAAGFAAESRFLEAQAEADAAEAAARAEAGPDGAGLTGIVARNLGLLKEALLAGLPADAADDLRAAIEARFAAEAGRRLDRAAAEEVRTGREATRARLNQMQANLLERIAREPERAEDLAGQGERFTAVNTLPAAERAERLDDWRARVAEVRGGARRQEDRARAPAGATAESAAATAGGAQTAIEQEVSSRSRRAGVETTGEPGDATRAAEAAGFSESEIEAIRQTQHEIEARRFDGLIQPGSISASRLLPQSRPVPGPKALRHLRDHPQSFGDFIDHYGIEHLPQDFQNAPDYRGRSILSDLNAMSAERTDPNPYIAIDRTEAVLTTVLPGTRPLPGRARSAAGAAVQGTANVVAKAPESLALADERYRHVLLKFLREFDLPRGKKRSPLRDIRASDRVRAYNASPEDRRAWIAELEAVRPEEHFGNRLGRAITEGAERHFPVNPLYDDEIQQQVAGFAGTLAGYAIFALATRGVGLGSTTGAVLAGSAQQRVAGFEKALAQGATIEEAFKASEYAALVGLSEAIPIARLLDRFDKGSGGSMRRLLIEAVKGGGENAVQEVAQTIAENLIASRLVAYDPDRELFTGLGEAAGISFGAGALLNAVAGLFGRKAARRPTGAGVGVATDTPVKYDPITRLRAQFELGQLKRNADRVFKSASAQQYFGPVWKNLPPHMQDFLEKRYRYFAGTAGEKIVRDRLQKAGFTNDQQTYYPLQPGVGRSARIYDDATSEELKLGLLKLFVVPGQRTAKPTGIEVKTAGSRRMKAQLNADDFLTDQMKYVTGVEVLRVPADRIGPEDLADVLDGWLINRHGQTRPGDVPRQDLDDLVRQLREYRGPDGKLLTIGQVSLIVLAETLPLVYPSETGEAERP